VNRSTYYRHFERKEDVVLYFLDTLTKDVLEWDKEQTPGIREHLVSVYEHYYSNKNYMMAIYRNGLAFLLLDVLKKRLGAAEHNRHAVNVQYDLAFQIGGTFNHFLLWFSRGMMDSPEEMADHTLAVLPEELVDHLWSAPKRKGESI